MCFEICVRESQPNEVMSSYNMLNGVHTSEHKGLLEDVLRCEFGFKGIVMTDWVIDSIGTNKKSIYRGARADEVAKAGGDIFMPGSEKDYKIVVNALKDGSLKREQLEINASRLLKMIDKLVRMSVPEGGVRSFCGLNLITRKGDGKCLESLQASS